MVAAINTDLRTVQPVEQPVAHLLPVQLQRFSGPGRNPGYGHGAQATGNIGGWAVFNPDTAYLTGIVLPQGIRDPYVYNDFLSIQREILPTVSGDRLRRHISHKLFRAQDINRHGCLLPAGATVTDNLGRLLTGLGGRPKPNFGALRNWQNAVNSAYNGLHLGEEADGAWSAL